MTRLDTIERELKAAYHLNSDAMARAVVKATGVEPSTDLFYRIEQIIWRHAEHGEPDWWKLAEEVEKLLPGAKDLADAKRLDRPSVDEILDCLKSCMTQGADPRKHWLLGHAVLMLRQAEASSLEARRPTAQPDKADELPEQWKAYVKAMRKRADQWRAAEEKGWKVDGHAACADMYAAASYLEAAATQLEQQAVAQPHKAAERIRELLPLCRPAHVTHQIERLLSALPPADTGLDKEHPSEPADCLKALEDQCWDLRCVAEPTGGDDADIAWHVVGHWMSQPQERVIGYGRTPQEAIKDAMRPRDYEGNLSDEEDITARVTSPWPVRQHRPSFQSRVAAWMNACFGPVISADKVERNHRFLEEALELVQACGCSREESLQLVDYVYGRPVGEPRQETGGVEVTLAALCLANGIDKDEAAEAELARVWTKIEQIRAKQAAKPRGSVLPISPSYNEKSAEDIFPASPKRGA